MWKQVGWQIQGTREQSLWRRRILWPRKNFVPSDTEVSKTVYLPLVSRQPDPNPCAFPFLRKLIWQFCFQGWATKGPLNVELPPSKTGCVLGVDQPSPLHGARLCLTQMLQLRVSATACTLFVFSSILQVEDNKMTTVLFAKKRETWFDKSNCVLWTTFKKKKKLMCPNRIEARMCS